MDQIVLIASIGSDLAGVAKGIGERFGVDWPHFIAQVISFSIVAGLLYRFAYRPILNVLDARRQRIAESLANADKIKAELANAQAKSEEIIGQAGQQANRIIEEARNAAAAVGEQERQKAVAEAQQILAKAREAGDAELVRLKNELRKEFGRLVVSAASQSTANILTSEQKGRLAEDAVKQLAA